MALLSFELWFDIRGQYLGGDPNALRRLPPVRPGDVLALILAKDIDRARRRGLIDMARRDLDLMGMPDVDVIVRFGASSMAAR